MNEHKKNEDFCKGEIGLAALISFVSNTLWKRVKIGIFKTIKEKPHEFVKREEQFSEEEKLELEQFLAIEIICETVSYIELLGAYLLAFSRKNPVIQKTLFEYEVKEVIKIFEGLEKQDIDGIAELIGYPQLFEFGPNLEEQKDKIEEYKKSLENIKNVLKEIGDFYLTNREFYNDYKHGFRIFPTTSSPPDNPVFGVAVQMKRGSTLNQAVFYTKQILDKKVGEALKMSDRVAQILEELIPVFRDRFIEGKKQFNLRLFGVPEDKIDEK